MQELFNNFNIFLLKSKSFLSIGGITDVFYINILYSLIFILILNALKNRSFIIITLILPGTLLHEISHFLMSMITNGKPVSLSLIPKRRGQTWVLGSVTSSNVKWYNAFFIGMSPFLLIPLSIILMNYFMDYKSPYFLLNSFLVSTFVLASIPSTTDFKIAFKFTIMPVLFIGGTIGLIYYFDVDIKAIYNNIISFSPNTYFEQIGHEINDIKNSILKSLNSLK